MLKVCSSLAPFSNSYMLLTPNTNTSTLWSVHSQSQKNKKLYTTFFFSRDLRLNLVYDKVELSRMMKRRGNADMLRAVTKTNKEIVKYQVMIVSLIL